MKNIYIQITDLSLSLSVCLPLSVCLCFSFSEFCTKVFQRFCNILGVRPSLQHIYHATKAVQDMRSTPMDGSVMVVGVLACCPLFHFLWDMKFAQMHAHRSLQNGK